MCFARHASMLFGLGFFLAWTCLPITVQAQTSEIAARRSLTGQQLFEREWKWVESEPRPLGPVTSNLQSGQTIRARGVMGDGLGPLHNATSCAACHVGGGGSGVDHNVTLLTVDPRSDTLSDRGNGGQVLLDVFPLLLSPNGNLAFTTVVHDRSTRPGYDAIRSGLASFVPGGLKGSWFDPYNRNREAIAEQPVVAGRYGELDFYLSQRNSPALFGLGVIDRINDQRVRELAERQAKRTSGEITGRFAGKFGWRGQVNSLQAFVSQACAGELGLNLGSFTLPIRQRTGGTGSRTALTAVQPADPADFRYVNFGPDMTEDELLKLVSFVAAIPRPTEYPNAPHSIDDVIRGEELFNSIGCAECHVPDLNHVSGMFSDLLLHDMGPRLQGPDPAPIDRSSATSLTTMTIEPFVAKGPGTRLGSPSGYYGVMSESAQSVPRPYPLSRPATPQFPRGELPSADSDANAEHYWDVLQREWRTPPLWGVADTAPYLHDGRAKTLDEAIRWHGGEADSSRDRFEKLTPDEQTLVIAFLSSLHAPEANSGQFAAAP